MGVEAVATRKVVIEVEVPEEVAVLLEANPLVKRLLGELGVRELERRLLDLAVLDSLSPGPGLSEEEIMEIDEKVKEGLARRYKVEGSS